MGEGIRAEATPVSGVEMLVVAVAAIVVIAAATTVAPKVRIAGPLILVAIGLGVSLLPFVPVVEVDPDIILVGVLPPLLYSAAVSLPAIEFRRDLRPIAGLSVLLVLISSVVLALFFLWAIPGLGFPLALALGAILSPTDAVATTIAKRLGISRRVVTLLEGESMLNDATSLVLLRTAIAAAGVGSVHFGEFALSFVWGVIVAVIIGALIGWANLRMRAFISNSAANTAVGFTVPFLAYLPTEQLGGSGLVAAVVAGIVTGQGAARRFTPEQRLSDELNWRTVELMLEGAVFLLMGLELKDLLLDNAGDGLGRAVTLAAGALLIVLGVRTVYVGVLVGLQSTRARRLQRERLDAITARIDLIHPPDTPAPPHLSPRHRATVSGVRAKIGRAYADLDYYAASPLGWKHGAVIVWAGMRGVVTLAAAQTLPRDTDERSLVVFVAFLVAVGSLMLQGLTLPGVVKLLRMPRADEQVTRSEQDALDDELRDAASGAVSDAHVRRRDGSLFDDAFLAEIGPRLVDPPEDAGLHLVDRLELRLALIRVMRSRLEQVSRSGRFSTAALRHALAELDADQLSLELRLEDEAGS
ncbi:cation:proton antiporter [Microbacterium aquimaris]|uniref:Cation:proton antiporter n=1 Tax=Microbacterium aquimaris TaxID=459816 RepID=A0ABU5N353_9MICO|nr:cation:proton antiporter [Microbacterium aquimaris]MDZ8160504.1 cation:proton antiporter [Microbacterium aquimaris]